MGRVGVSVVKERFLLGICFIYLFAFASLYIQLPGLYSKNGITPVHVQKLPQPKDFTDFLKEPNLLRFHSFLNLDKYQCLELFTVLGVILSALGAFFPYFRNALTLFILWALYLSILKVGQAGLVAFLLSSFGRMVFLPQSVASDRISVWLLKWLLFRLMFSSGIVKLTSNCPRWWDLTALNWHFQSQCIPTPTAWHFHHLPHWIHNLFATGTFILEIPLPLLFFVPLSFVRLFSFYTQVIFQFMIILSGNYNFFNLLTIVLCYSLLKDDDFGRKRKQHKLTKVLSILLSLLIIGAVIGVSGYYFNVKYANGVVHSSIGFTKSEFDWFLRVSTHGSIFIGIGLFFVEVMIGLITAFNAPKAWRKLYELNGVIFVALIGAFIMSSSLVSFSALDNRVQSFLPPHMFQVHKTLQPFYVTNSYGLFRRMTGVGARPELIIEAGPTENGPWTEYNFVSKPDRLDKMPPIIVPHQPRLDWQMWFAALKPKHEDDWFMNLIYRLLQQKREVLELLDVKTLPKNPVFIQAKLYEYQFTKSSSDKNWWHRSQKSIYLSPVSLNSKLLKDAIAQTDLLKTETDIHKPNVLSVGLKNLRRMIGQPSNLSSVLIVVIMALITNRAFNRANPGLN